MDIRQLRYFLRILELKNYHRASEALGVAQPALSAQIAKLEAELDVKLFVRHARGIEPTEAGLILAEHAKTIIRQVGEAQRATHAGGDQASGQLAIGMPPSVGFSFAPAVIERFVREFPRVHLTIIPGFNGFLQEWLADHRIQLAIIYDPSPNSRLQKEFLFDERITFVAPAKDAQIREQLKSASDLEKISLILPSRSHGLRLIIDEVSVNQNIELNIRMEVDALQLIREFVLRGLGYTLLPFSAVAVDVEAGLLQAIDIPGLPLRRKLVLARSSRDRLGVAGERLAEYFREMAREIRSEQQKARTSQA